MNIQYVFGFNVPIDNSLSKHEMGRSPCHVCQFVSTNTKLNTKLIILHSIRVHFEQNSKVHGLNIKLPYSNISAGTFDHFDFPSTVEPSKTSCQLQ